LLNNYQKYIPAGFEGIRVFNIEELMREFTYSMGARYDVERARVVQKYHEQDMGLSFEAVFSLVLAAVRVQ